MASIFSLYGNIFVENEDANKKIEETTEKGKRSSKTFAEGFAEVSKKVVAVGTAVAGATTAVVSGALAMANNTAQAADEIDKASIRMGIDTKTFQELKYAAGQCGVEMSVMEKAAKKLEGTDINMQDAMHQIMSLSTAEERAAKASELFGDSVAYQMSPLIEQSTESYDELIQRANDLGLIMSDDAVNAGVEFGDLMSDVKQSIGALTNDLVNAFMPILNDLLKMVIEYMPTIKDIIGKLAPIITQTLKTIVPIFMQMVEDIFPILVDILNNLMPIIAEIIEIVLPIFVKLITILLPPLMQIVEALLPPLMQIIEALLPLLEPLLDLLAWAIDVVLMPIITVLTNIITLISNGLSVALRALTPVVKGVLSVFETVFGSIFNVVKVPINAIIDGINLFIKALNKIKIPDWVPGVGGKGINLALIKKLRSGIDFVPYDEMPAVLHKGERVLTAKENEIYSEKINSKEEKSPEQYTYNNNIVIEKMEVRKESDINEIAEELYYLLKKEVA